MWLAAALLALPAAAPAADVSVIGVFPGKGAVLVIDGGAPQSLRLGQKSGGLILVSVDKSGAVLDDAGQRRTSRHLSPCWGCGIAAPRWHWRYVGSGNGDHTDQRI